MSGVQDRHGLEILSFDESLGLLRSRPVGRLAYLDAGAPMIVPVNHLVVGSTIVLRSLPGGKLDAAVVKRPVAFQVDDYDPSRRSGWSVVVRGSAHLIEEDEATEYASQLDSWAIGDAAASWIRIVADEISGRRLRRPS